MTDYEEQFVHYNELTVDIPVPNTKHLQFVNDEPWQMTQGIEELDAPEGYKWARSRLHKDLIDVKKAEAEAAAEEEDEEEGGEGEEGEGEEGAEGEGEEGEGEAEEAETSV